VYDADMEGYFDSIPHDKLMACVRMRVVDGSVLRLIEQWLNAAVEEKDGNGRITRKRNRQGTPQGGVISPLLANIYLHYALDLWFEKVYRKSCTGVARLIRYADDCVPRTHRGVVFLKVRCCTKDEGRPLGAGLQAQASNHLKLQG